MFCLTLKSIAAFWGLVALGFFASHETKTGSESIYVWYLLVVELQGTSRGEERKGGPNPFWEKLCGGRLKESGVQRKAWREEHACDLHLNQSRY